jgi:hypothetical protein
VWTYFDSRLAFFRPKFSPSHLAFFSSREKRKGQRRSKRGSNLKLNLMHFDRSRYGRLWRLKDAFEENEGTVNAAKLGSNMVLCQRYECQHAECKHAERHSAEFRENVTVPKRHYTDVKKCRNVTIPIL